MNASRLGSRSKLRLVAASGMLLLSVAMSGGVDAAEPLDTLLGEAEVTYPDVVPNVTELGVFESVVWDPETETFLPGHPTIYFDTYSQNVGTVPVEVTADDPTNTEDSTVSQCVAWTNRVCREQRPVGGFTWHAEHSHFHYEDFARYELRRLRRGGRVDYSKRGLVAVSDKVSFCLIDSERVRDDAFPAPAYHVCTALRQGISPGWADIYTSDLEGQQFVVPGLVDGRYALVVTLDTANTLYETDDTNNRVVLIIDVSYATETVTIVDRYWPAVKQRK